MAAIPSVLIVGAGPAGLVLAIILRQNGITVRIIDKEETHRIGSRGSGIQPRTLELYDIMGILPAIRAVGEPIPAMAKYEPGELKPTSTVRLTEWVEPTPDVPHANALNLNQDDHEAILRAHLGTLSCAVELGSELRRFEHFADRVVAHIVKVKTGPDQTVQEEEEIATFDWLVGTDGAHSVVRKQLGFSFLGETRTEQQMAVGDIVVEEGVDPAFWHMWSVPPKFIALRSSGRTNKKFMFAYSGRSEAVADKLLTRDEFIEDFYAITGRRDVKFGAATWMSNYRPNLRMVDRMRDGRVFIAGDAAHCHSPAGGQGLNSSVQDTANLAWKLALVVKGLASPALLDTYAEERLRVIAQMLELTTALFTKTFTGFTAGVDAEAWTRGREMSMLGVNYCGSSIVREEADAAGTLGAAGASASAYAQAEGLRVQAAYRAPDASGLVRLGTQDAATTTTTLFAAFSAAAHTILVFGGDASVRAGLAALGERFPGGAVRVVEVRVKGQPAGDVGGGSAALVLEDREGHAYRGYGVQPGALVVVVVVRPDGVVGAVANDAEGVEKYFEKILI